MAVYNAAAYLAEAIESVLRQTLTEWELLCVDDGSTDCSLELLNRYAAKEKRIRIFTQANAGPMSARVTGIQQAAGEYVIYLDSDDWFSDDLLEQTYSRALETGADVVAPDARMLKSSSWNKEKDIDTTAVLTGAEAFAETFPWRKVHGINLWQSGLIKRIATPEVIGDNNFNADEIVQRMLLLNCRKLVYSGGYYYNRHNPDSITRRLSMRQFKRFESNRILENMAVEYRLGTDIERKVKTFTFFTLLHLLKLFCRQRRYLTREERQVAWRLMKKEYHRYDDLKSLPMSRSKKLLLTNGFALFVFVVYLHSFLSKL